MAFKQLALFADELPSSKKALKIFTDGASRGNPGPSSIGIVFRQDDKKLFEAGYQVLSTTNNVAEYLALLFALTYLLQNIDSFSFSTLQILLDSELLVKQLNGIYSVKSPILKELFLEIKSVLSKLKIKIEINHVLRKYNQEADRIANLALDKKIVAPSWIIDLQKKANQSTFLPK